MGKIALLDCTLRDGGYVNDWKFGRNNLLSIFQRLVDAHVDIIEIGFLDDRRPFDIDRSIMPGSSCVEKIFGQLNRRQAMVVGMIDYGTCAIENLQPASESYLDGIRVIFKEHLKEDALEYCRKVKALGYNVFAQLVSVTTYTEESMKELIDIVNDVKPYALSMVDTYGLLHPDDLLFYYNIIDKYLDTDIQIGFHAHNNFQLAYANALAFLEKNGTHDIVVDGTLYGMGKSAGNAPIELLAMRLNDKFGKNYNIDSMLEAIEESIMSFYAKAPWGYKTFFYLCAKNKCHPSYLTYFEEKENLSTSKIDQLLSEIEPYEKKLLYDKLVAENLYNDFLTANSSTWQNDSDIKEELKDRNILIVGPGKNIVLQNDKVQKYIKEKTPYIISINYLPKLIKPDCIFVTNLNRYHDLTEDLVNQDMKIMATSNVECRNGEFAFVVNRAPLLENKEKIKDNSFLMLVKLLMKLDISEINCAGFDGYSDKEDNYFNPAMEYGFIKQEALNLNKHMKERISDFREKITINFITYSAYEEKEDIHGAAF